MTTSVCSAPLGTGTPRTGPGRTWRLHEAWPSSPSPTKGTTPLARAEYACDAGSAAVGKGFRPPAPSADAAIPQWNDASGPRVIMLIWLSSGLAYSAENGSRLMTIWAIAFRGGSVVDGRPSTMIRSPAAVVPASARAYRSQSAVLLPISSRSAASMMADAAPLVAGKVRAAGATSTCSWTGATLSWIRRGQVPGSRSRLTGTKPGWDTETSHKDGSARSGRRTLPPSSVNSSVSPEGQLTTTCAPGTVRSWGSVTTTVSA